jgi:hypothetical protein
MTVFVSESNTGKASASRGRARAANEDEVKSKARGGRVRGASRPDPATMRPPSGPDYNVACPHLRLEALPNSHPGQYFRLPPEMASPEGECGPTMCTLSCLAQCVRLDNHAFAINRPGRSDDQLRCK